MEGNWSTSIICIALAVIAVVSVRGYVKRLKSGCCGGGGDEVRRVRPVDRDAAHYPYVCKITVDGMTCKNCALRIENAFHGQEGFYAKVELRKHAALVRMKEPASDETLREIVRQAGYLAARVEWVDRTAQDSN